MRSGGGAVFVGALVGITLALARWVVTERAEAPPPGLPPLGAQPAPAESTPPEPATAPPRTPSASVSSTPSTVLAETPTSAPSAPPAPTASTAPAASSFPTVAPLPPLTTAKEVERSERRCYERKSPDECERAAVAYAAGLAGKPDAERAARLARVAVTFVVRECEERSPHACLALAGRYKTGHGVPQSDRKANAVLEHARELCRERARVECVGGEPR
jgi:hypothetical protein